MLLTESKLPSSEQLLEPGVVDERDYQLTDQEEAELEARPGLTLKNTVMQLRHLYSGRRYGDRFFIGDRALETTIIPTRYEDGIGVQELHSITEEYGPDLRHPRVGISAVMTRQLDSGGDTAAWESAQIDVDIDDHVTVLYMKDGETVDVDASQQYQLLKDYSEQAKRALLTHERRTKDQRSAADEAACQYFEIQHPEYVGSVAQSE